ncbi:L-aminoadipate-semialdehyde dehydrogenase [Suillus discolor]|uniref:L-aminoadipate-semialdehyde dehydrogenase n=1 Tax=Suillus discolor TaxID=1912936 RepID=A0A9P7JME7_9AGAM|nr:L-aminoadipate-semialdehyde dehydrogenase [Suillus discolor]KAG2088169.1 L-aminoadipate-semialdehyde dehydrogenase [Suillus discolor]
MALYRMGYCVLFLPPNNSPSAIAHLLTVTDATHVIVQDALLPPAAAALTHLSNPSSVTIINQPSSDVFGSAARSLHPEKTRWDPALKWEDESLLPVTVIHTSGSTGFPKPTIATNKVAIGKFLINFGLASLTTVPLYRAYGHGNLYRAICAAKPLYLFPTGSMSLTSTNVIKLLKQAPDVEALFGVPLALKLLAETTEGLQVLKNLKLVSFSGSPCPDELGDFLVNEGVRLIGYYGATETGQLMTSFRDFETDKGWNWTRAKGPYVNTNVNDYLRFEPLGGDTYELLVLDGWPHKATFDPMGRTQRKIYLSSIPPSLTHTSSWGELTTPWSWLTARRRIRSLMELTLRSSPYIADAIIFGAGRIQIGALILPTEIAKDCSASELAKLVAPIVALANAEAPSHSQLASEALVFLPHGTVIPRADKGSIIRPRVYKEFEGIVNEAYKRLEGDIDEDGKRRLIDEADARMAIRDVIGKTVDQPIDSLEDDTDLFDFGLDSLQSSRIRNTIQREIYLGGKKPLAPNTVFELPSITQIARLLIAMSSGNEGALAQRSSLEIVLELVEKYSSFAYTQKAHANGTNGTASNSVTPRVVVLTGATGSLGVYILDELLSDPSVATVYCLCRAEDDADASSRITASKKTRKLFTRYEQVQTRVKALASDLSTDKLGLQTDMYNEIATRATLIIHSNSFEPHIREAVNLINLALASPHPRPADFYFASSISAVAAWHGPDSIPEAITDDPSVAQGLGYGSLKSSAKLPLSQQTPIRAGELAKWWETQNGVWNETEAISLIIKCTDTIGILPNLDESVSWLPVDYAAKAIIDLVNVPPQPLQHAGLKFKALPRHEWIKALRASPIDEVNNPSRKLLTFFENKYGQEELVTRYPLLTVQTKKASNSLRSAPIADDGLVRKWVAAWRETDFLA